MGTKVKYLLQPGYVRSKNDRQTHYIDSRTLAHLYRVRLDECTLHANGRRLMRLRPRYDGDYRLPTTATRLKRRLMRTALIQLLYSMFVAMFYKCPCGQCQYERGELWQPPQYPHYPKCNKNGD